MPGLCRSIAALKPEPAEIGGKKCVWRFDLRKARIDGKIR